RNRGTPHPTPAIRGAAGRAARFHRLAIEASGQPDSIRRAGDGAVFGVRGELGRALVRACGPGGSLGTEDRRRGGEGGGLRWTKIGPCDWLWPTGVICSSPPLSGLRHTTC